MYTVPLFLNCLATLLEKWDKKIQSFFVFSKSLVSRIWFSDLHKLQRFVISATERYTYTYICIISFMIISSVAWNQELDGLRTSHVERELLLELNFLSPSVSPSLEKAMPTNQLWTKKHYIHALNDLTTETQNGIWKQSFSLPPPTPFTPF